MRHCSHAAGYCRSQVAYTHSTWYSTWLTPSDFSVTLTQQGTWLSPSDLPWPHPSTLHGPLPLSAYPARKSLHPYPFIKPPHLNSGTDTHNRLIEGYRWLLPRTLAAPRDLPYLSRVPDSCASRRNTEGGCDVIFLIPKPFPVESNGFETCPWVSAIHAIPLLRV